MSATAIAISVKEQKHIHNFKNLLNVVNKYSIDDAAKSYLKNKDRHLIHIIIFFMNQYETAIKRKDLLVAETAVMITTTVMMILLM